MNAIPNHHYGIHLIGLDQDGNIVLQSPVRAIDQKPAIQDKFFNVSVRACASARELVSIRGQYLRQWRIAREPGCTRNQADHSQPL